ncbi:hypothetical protein BDW74DRAFT_159656 [Aspergillus multicolor]|uniref:uncharacterized protein n=1 Tax=Aspergillus multicolor TaxID=41759 RepID=UPI003CCC9D29
MPALVDLNSENRRPRRPSITQQLQRMFHIDKAGNASGVLASPLGYSSADGPSEISSAGRSRHSHSSLNSKPTDLQSLESKHSSLQSLHLEPLPDPPPKQDPKVKAGHTVVQKKDRRATKRLEAERLELEKRLIKLEEAERTGDTSVLRRQSRKLSKKQPLGSSSRSSSVSGDESRSRTSLRLSSIFSNSRRRSRSRCSSNDGADELATETTLPALSSTLPERLSTAISKELAARKNAILGPPGESSQSPKTATESTSSQPTIGNGEEGAFAAGAINDDMYTSAPADLDRKMFTASLASKRRSAMLESHTFGARATPGVYDDRPRSTMPGVRSQLTRASTEGVVQRHQKKFRSSPLAESHTIGVDATPITAASPQVAEKRLLKLEEAYALPSSKVSSHNIIGELPSHEARNARSHMSRMPTSKLNKVIGPSIGKPKAIGTLSPPRRERDSSPTVPPKSPKRDSKRLLQLEEADGRPTLGQSKAEDTESDYNTADEVASIESRVSDGVLGTGHPAEGSKIEPKRAPKKRNLGQLVPKLFVICCCCKFWHDLPSEVYAGLAVSDPLSAALGQELARGHFANWLPSMAGPTSLPKMASTADIQSGPVRCCWCHHPMSKGCCQGWSTLVQMRKRHH